MLYNAFHIGDLVVSVSGIVIKNANEAQKIIRNASSFYVRIVLFKCKKNYYKIYFRRLNLSLGEFHWEKCLQLNVKSIVSVLV